MQIKIEETRKEIKNHGDFTFPVNVCIEHIEAYAQELKSAGVETDDVSPLLLPKYARHER